MTILLSLLNLAQTFHRATIAPSPVEMQNLQSRFARGPAIQENAAGIRDACTYVVLSAMVAQG